MVLPLVLDEPADGEHPPSLRKSVFRAHGSGVQPRAESIKIGAKGHRDHPICSPQHTQLFE